MCIFSYWIYYVTPGCIIVHLPLTTVRVCVDPVGVGQVYGVAKELRMSLRDISTILRNSQVNHGVVITDNSNDKTNSISNKSPNEKATQSYRLFSEGKSHLK